MMMPSVRRMIMATIGQVITQAHAEYEAKYARRKQRKKPRPQHPLRPPQRLRNLRLRPSNWPACKPSFTA